MPGYLGFSLPKAPEEYDPVFMQELIDYLRELEHSVYLKANHVEIFAQDDSGGRHPYLILRSPDGTRWRIDVADTSGALSTTDIGDEGL